jgi:outer membrane protein assembly factor BamB
VERDWRPGKRFRGGSRSRVGVRRLRLAALVVAAAALTAGIAFAATPDQAAPPGTPPEVSANLTAFPAPNANYTNDRVVTGSRITTANVATLTKAWSFALSGKSPFGVFSANPIVTKDAVYLQDMNSNVFKLDRATGALVWQRKFNDLSTGPTGVAIGNGLVFGGTATDAFALDDATGAIKWKRKLIRKKSEGIDMAPLVWNNMVIISTVPGDSLTTFYGGGGRGVVHALDATTGATKWTFDTIKSKNLWGNPKINSGGGLWGTPSVDANGDVYVAVANPGVFPGTKEFPNGTSRPGPNLYTNSLVVLNGLTGKVKWHYQAIKHDIRDWDLQLGPILATFTINGTPTDVVVLSGKMGTVYVVDRTTHKLIWKRDVGIHLAEDGPNRNAPFKKAPVKFYPGFLGGVETPMAVADGVIYVPVNNLCSIMVAQKSYADGGFVLCDFSTASGQTLALDGATGKVVWNKKVKQMNFGGATVANDLVFATYFNGVTYAYNRATGAVAWRQPGPAQGNATPAIAEDLVVVGTGFAPTKRQKASVVAYRLP